MVDSNVQVLSLRSVLTKAAGVGVVAGTIAELVAAIFNLSFTLVLIVCISATAPIIAQLTLKDCAHRNVSS